MAHRRRAHVIDDDDLMSEGSSDYEGEMMSPRVPQDNAYAFQKRQATVYDGQNADGSRCPEMLYLTRWHRKGLVIFALVAAFIVYSVRMGKAQKYYTDVSDRVHGWVAWARSPAGGHFIGVLMALVVLDVAVDLGYGVWTQRRARVQY